MLNKIALPQAIEAEKAALGAVLTDESVSPVVCTSLSPADFSDQRNRLVFESMLRLFSAKKAIDPTVVVTDLKTNKTIDDVGGVDYLFELVQSCVAPSNASFYCKIIRDHSRLKNYILTLEDVIRSYAEGEMEDPSSFIAETKPKIDDAAVSGSSDGFQPIGGVVSRMMDQVSMAKEAGARVVTGIDTGFPSLNAITHGFHKNDLIIIAARPSMGKTALAGNIVSSMAEKGGTAAFISLEMTPEQIALRMCAAAAEVPSDSLLTGRIGEGDYQKVVSSAAGIGSMKVFFDDCSTGLVGDVVASISRIKINNPELSLVVIDYLGLMRVGAKVESRQVEVASITRSLKRLARTLGIAIVALCQLNRESEGSDGSRPTLANLRESGAIEQDADVVVLIHRPGYYTSRKAGEAEKFPSVAELIVAKNRNGATGIAKTDFYNDKCVFKDDNPKLNDDPAKARVAENAAKRRSYQSTQKTLENDGFEEDR